MPFVLQLLSSWLILGLCIGLAASWALQRIGHRLPARVMLVLGTIAIECSLPFFIAYWLFWFPSSDTFVSKLPPAFEVTEAVVIERDVMCEVSAHHYSEDTQREITKGGLMWLNSTAWPLHERGSDQRYVDWELTPHPDVVHNRPGSRWLAGFSCLRDHGALKSALKLALLEPGSYYTHLQRNKGAGLLLVPSAKLIVYLAGE